MGTVVSQAIARSVVLPGDERIEWLHNRSGGDPVPVRYLSDDALRHEWMRAKMAPSRAEPALPDLRAFDAADRFVAARPRKRFQRRCNVLAAACEVARVAEREAEEKRRRDRRVAEAVELAERDYRQRQALKDAIERKAERLRKGLPLAPEPNPFDLAARRSYAVASTIDFGGRPTLVSGPTYEPWSASQIGTASPVHWARRYNHIP